ncbi:heme ABC transporter ATP-binding protein/permease CydC [Ferrimonas lipolytica]|uniref:Cysteine/glutathione ABC transporter ATP-binding protein/permease CydC n=1 Tax=Ferrimonas lipolytica TaxID=2724191 RepID=A0A6H1UC55_9GAMM|nr:cysteine/glutathione ABC transporter ATP-binding protein/permease CydC [Ferrimonas lipolytica]QIZ76655.1 cysteine/glutathione ABC transporter ATP-binding protein/permease CydC [Ferrimonas lipolytica]
MDELKPFLHLYRRQWRRLAFGLVFAVLTLLASIGLLSISGWFISASAVAGLVIARSADFNYLMPAGAVRGLSLGRTVFRWADRVISHDATFRLLATLRSWFFRRLGPLRTEQIKGVRQADLLNRMVADIDSLDHVYLRLITPLVAGSFTIIAVSLLVGYFAPIVGLSLGLVLTALMLILPLLFYRLGKTPGERIGDEQMMLRQHMLEYLQGHNELRVFDALGSQQSKIKQHESALIESQQTMANLTGASQGMVVLFTGWVMLAVLLLSYQVFSADNAVGPLLALIVFAVMASFEAIAPVAGAFQHLGQTQTAAKRLNEILQQPSEVTYGTQPAATSVNLTVEAVSYRYGNNPEPVLDNLSLVIGAGNKCALVGQTGCGKSTLLQLLTRELSAESGTISVNGTPLQDFSESGLRQMICVVSQQIHVFNDSLANNLRLAAPDASDDELILALQQVQLDKLLSGDGLQQWLGDGGRLLSGGEQRRLGLARAMLHPAPLLLLDEPTEGLDDDTEVAIIDQLMNHRPDRSMLYVTHKPAALAHMDQIQYMANGKLSVS